MPSLSTRAASAPASPIRRLAPLARAARERGIHIYSLNIGQPDLPTPEPIRRAVRAYDATCFAYSPSEGEATCRSALLRFFRENVAEDLADGELIVTTAGSEALQFALATTMNPGDTVLVPEPLYPNYLGFASLLGVRVAPIPCSIERGYHLPDDLDRHVVPGSRALLFANPGNPTGTVYRPDELDRLAELARRHDLFIIADEVYREIVFDGGTSSMLTRRDLDDRLIVVDSVSKRFSACGVRIGAFISRHRDIMAAAQRYAMARLSPPTLGQVAIAAIGELGDDYFAELVGTYRRRRDVVVETLRSVPGVRCPVPEGAFYAMVGLPIDDADDFASFLLTSFERDGATTLVAPGSGFYASPSLGRNEIRIAYVLEEEELRRALGIVVDGLAAYNAQRAQPGIAAGVSSHTPSKT